MYVVLSGWFQWHASIVIIYDNDKWCSELQLVAIKKDPLDANERSVVST